MAYKNMYIMPIKGVTILAATKGRTVKEISQAVAAGISVIGENRVQELLNKLPHLPKQIRIDFIGHLQNNKVKDIVGRCRLIHSVDSFRLAEEINKQTKKIGIKQDILLQVNLTGEETKFGFRKNELIRLFPRLLALKNIDIKGLMTMAPLFADPEKARSVFQETRLLRDLLADKYKTSLPELSMGMSNDFLVAIEEDSTIIRLGRVIFDS